MTPSVPVGKDVEVETWTVVLSAGGLGEELGAAFVAVSGCVPTGVSVAVEVGDAATAVLSVGAELAGDWLSAELEAGCTDAVGLADGVADTCGSAVLEIISDRAVADTVTVAVLPASNTTFASPVRLPA